MADAIELILKNTAQRVDILVSDADGETIDATNGPHLTVLDIGDNVVYRDTYPEFVLTGTVSVAAGQVLVTGVGTKFQVELTPGNIVTIAGEDRTVDVVNSDTSFTLTVAHTAGAAGVSMTRTSRIVKPVGTVGQYYLLWGDPTAPENLPDQQETNYSRGYFFHWRVTGSVGAEETNVIQGVKVVSARVMSLANQLALRIDKAAKEIDEDPDDPVYLGYSTWMLISFLEGGLQRINGFQPYPVWRCVDNFPFDIHGAILLDAAMFDALTSQELYAVDTDVTNYSDQGNVFNIQHQPQLNAIVAGLWQRLKESVPPMKRQYVQSGAIHTQAGPSFRFQQLLDASPSGRLFRNLFTT